MLLFLLLLGEVEVVNEIHDLWLPDYSVEVRLWDKSRCDLLGNYAIEVDWAHKWAEAVGQSRLYGRITGRPPGIILLVEGLGWEKYAVRCLLASSGPVWIYDTSKKRFVNERRPD